MWLSVVRAGLIAMAVAFVLAQFVPYGREHAQPPVQAEPAWNNPSTRALAVRACYDCHSNETKWPWYSQVAPMSWLVQWDVQRGRQELNFSEWNRRQEGADEAAETVQKGSMPPRAYLLLHPEARLSATEREALIQGLQATFPNGRGRDRGRGGR